MNPSQARFAAFDRAFGGALDNELAEGLDAVEARQAVLRKARAYADTYGLDADAFADYVATIVPAEPFDWYCQCNTVNGGADRRCVNCNRRRYSTL